MTTIRATSAFPTPAPTTPPASAVPDYLQPEVIAERTEAGRRAEFTADTIPPSIIERGAPSYFRTYDQLKGAMYDLQTRYPNLVRVEDIGDSFEKTRGTADRDVLALVLTNQATAGDDKPAVMHVGGVHAREIANPELLMTFGQQLLDGYGRDAEATNLLDTRRIVLVPMVNPDGHAVIERAYAGQPGGNAMQRKNTSGAGGEGTDLNRNFDFHWGGPGAGSSPRSETYRGAAPASEPETQAIQGYITKIKPKMFVDWHSYSKLNLYPWGDTREHTPDHAGFKAMAEKFSTYNHYSPIQAVDLYPTTGTTDDYAYGARGVAGMAVETGSSFHQDDREFAQTLRENLPALQYTVKVADAPLSLVHGPDAFDVVVDPATRQLSARVSDANNGRNALAGAEVVLDPKAPAGSGLALRASDGAFDGTDETVTGDITRAPGFSPDAGDGAMVYVRGRDADGNWGPLTAQWLAGPPASTRT